ncbi:hypothetical protein MKW92_020560 [Papaver armeniacum]|nr:hypothetical protein MKW92_020560 [Papaver armeniacum]
MSTLKKALDLSAHSFNNLLSTIQPDLLIYDFIQPWAATQASRLNIPAIQLLTTGADFTSFFAHLVKKNPDTKFPFLSIYLYDHEERKVTEKSSFSDDSEDRDRVFQCINKSNDMVLINTFKEIEEKYLDYLSSTVGKELVPVGPLLQNPTTNNTSCDHEQENKFRELLVNKENSSVVFVSLSEVNFIWVIRFPGDQKETDGLGHVLPKGFMERIGEKGLVVENWAPQAKLLRSSKIGGFVSHCGWNSVLESMKYGVPIIAMCSSRLVVELGLGVEVNRDGDGKLDRREIAKAIRKVVIGREGIEVQGKAKEMSQKMRCGDEDIDELVEKLERLCNKGRIQNEQ